MHFGLQLGTLHKSVLNGVSYDEQLAMDEARHMSLKLEIGKRYVRRDGQVTGPLTQNVIVLTRDSYPFYDPTDCESYKPNGRWYSDNTDDPLDLVFEYAETPLIVAAGEPLQTKRAFTVMVSKRTGLVVMCFSKNEMTKEQFEKMFPDCDVIEAVEVK